MDIFNLAGQLHEAKQAIKSDPMGETRTRHSLARANELEGKVAELANRLKIIEVILAKAVGLSPEQLQDLIASQLPKVAERKTTEELKLETVPCPECGRSVHKNLPNCQICGGAIR